jgi:Phage conserved hypothetical protein BR0599
MLQLTYNSQTVFVVNDAWNGNESFECQFSLVRDTQTGLTKHEARRPFSATLRVKANYSATVRGAAMVTLLAQLRALNDQPVVIPFWPAVGYWANRASLPMDGGLKIVWKSDWSQFAIYTEEDGEPGWPAEFDFVAPALWGFLTPTKPELLDPDAATWEVDFTESSPATYALIVPDSTAVAGPKPAGYTTAPSVLPFTPDFSAVSEITNVDVQRDDAGFTREQFPTLYPQPPQKKQAANYAFLNGEWPQFLSFFQNISAIGESFWAPGWFRCAKLSANVAATDTVIDVEDSSAIAGGDWLMFFSGGVSTLVQVDSTGDGTITLTAEIGVALPAKGAEIYPLVLVRQDKPLLKLSFSDVNVAHSAVEWTEAGAEYEWDASETLGATLGKLNQRIILFQFTRDYLDGTVIEAYYTNYEKGVSYGGNDYSYQNMSHGDIPQTLNLEADTMDFDSFYFAGNPLLPDLTLDAVGILEITVSWADFDGTTVSNITQVFNGQLASCSRKGNKLSAKFGIGPLAALDGMLPKLVRGTMCNHLKGTNTDGSFLISYGCTLLKANFEHTAIVASLVSAYPYQLNLTGLTFVPGGTPPVYFANWFALGWCEIGSGATLQRRFITTSTNPVSGALTLNFSKWFNPAPNIGDTVTFYPGCDGIYTTCQAYNAVTNPTGKFNNFLNFGGEPFLPPGNPSLTAMIQNPAAGTKK